MADFQMCKFRFPVRLKKKVFQKMYKIDCLVNVVVISITVDLRCPGFDTKVVQSVIGVCHSDDHAIARLMAIGLQCLAYSRMYT